VALVNYGGVHDGWRVAMPRNGVEPKRGVHQQASGVLTREPVAEDVYAVSLFHAALKALVTAAMAAMPGRILLEASTLRKRATSTATAAAFALAATQHHHRGRWQRHRSVEAPLELGDDLQLLLLVVTVAAANGAQRPRHQGGLAWRWGCVRGCHFRRRGAQSPQDLLRGQLWPDCRHNSVVVDISSRSGTVVRVASTCLSFLAHIKRVVNHGPRIGCRNVQSRRVPHGERCWSGARSRAHRP